ncbi:hypothetical protein [Actinomyces respiraculi]|uniref:hypothetical protein n=1 Tax=Actinomyces respiraculi TaxID=2744574 RepID=UPI0018E07C32|nr:hypothetical protein [Actinomyces respiraculi]
MLLADGSRGTALHGKELLVAVSPGAPADSYHHGGNARVLTAPREALGDRGV